MRKNPKMLKNSQKGITLIALVITIIVLLILAGVAISQITGNSSILQKAQNASDETAKAEETSNVQLAVAKLKAEKWEDIGRFTEQELTTALSGIETINSVTTENGKYKVIGLCIYEIDQYGNIELKGTAPKVPLTGLSGIPENSSIKVGEDLQLNPVKAPEDSNETIVFESTEPTVATVSNSGLIHGLSVGTTTITVKGSINGNIKQTCNLTVNPATVPLTGITLTKNPNSNSLLVGNYIDITATLSPENTTDTGVTFEITSSNPSGVVTLSNTTDLSTRVTGVKAGTATITVTGAQTTGVSTTYQVTVTDNISVTASASRSAGSISSTYTWTQLADFAKIISNNSSTITNNTEKVTITKNGTTYGVLVVGDTTTVTYKDSSKEVRILGFNHDELTSKTAASSPYSDGVAHTYAGISFEFTNSLGISKINSSDTNSGGWASCALKTGTTSSTIKGLDAYYLPKININSSIKQVKKKYNPTYSATGTATTTTDDKLWLLSCSEIWNNGDHFKYGRTKAKEGEQYKYYKLKNPTASETNTYLVKSSTSWWLRSPNSDGRTYFCFVSINR